MVKNLEPEIDSEDVLSYLKKRFGLIDGVCISGGEPTLYNDLPDFFKTIKNIGYSIKLDTNGTNPEMIKFLVENELIAYIAMDIKNSLLDYAKTIGKDYDMSRISESIKYIMNCGIDYEFRTTLVNELHSFDDIKQIAKLICGAKKYCLQKFIDSGNCLSSGLTEVPKSKAIEYQEYLKKYIPNTLLRGY